MLKMDTLRSFYFYRTNKHYLSPENTKSMIKGSLTAVLAPSIEEEFDHLDKLSNFIQIRNLKNYIIDKETTYPIFGTASRRVKTDMGMIHDLHSKHSESSNLSGISNFIPLKKDLKNNPTKGYNSLYEINNDLYSILNNPKDKRLPAVKRVDVIKYIEYALQEKIKNPVFDDFKVKNLFIPINRWVPRDQYRAAQFFSKTEDNFISMLYNELMLHPESVKVFAGWKVILTNFNEAMIIDVDLLINDLTSVDGKGKPKKMYEGMHQYIRDFMFKCKSSTTEISNDLSEDGINKDLTDVEAESEAHQEVEKLLLKQNIDINTADPDKVETIRKVVKDELKASGNTKKLESEIKSALKANPESQDLLDDLVRSRLTGRSMESYQRNKMLKEKYDSNKITLADGSVITIGDLMQTEDDSVITRELPANIINPSLKNLTAHNFAESYNEKLFYKDLVAILSHFSNCQPAMFIISDIEQEDLSDSMSRIVRYSVTYEDENRKRHNLKFILPKFYKDRYLFLNGSIKDIGHQKLPYPVTKINKDIVQLSSSYNKIFTNRKGQKVSPKVSRLLKMLLEKNYKHVSVKRGNASAETKGIMTTLEYDELTTKLYQINVDSWQVFFNIIFARFAVGLHPSNPNSIDYYLPLAYNTKTKEKLFLDSRVNDVVDSTGKSYGQLSDFIINLMAADYPEIKDEFDTVTVGNKFIYSEALIMAHHIPVVLVAASVARGGLSEVLSRSKINYRFATKREQIDKNNQEIVRFADGYLIYDRYPYENSILLNGLAVVPTKEYNFHEMDYRETYIDIFDLLYDKRNLIEGIENFNQLFVDPITLDVQMKVGGVTNFIDFLLISNDLLADNEYKSDISYDQSRIRSNEMVLVYLYQLLAAQYGKCRLNPSLKFTIQEDAVIKELLKSQVTDEHSGLNLPLEADTNRSITMKGPVGLNVDEAYTLQKRSFHDSMSGVVGMSTAPSGEVGVKRYLTHGVDIQSARGFIKPSDGEIDSYQMQTPAELMNTFSVESSDPQRAAMATNQAKQMVPTIQNDAPIITHDMERVIPHLSSDFAAKAKKDGKVVCIENDLMVIEYTDGTHGDFDLAPQTIKHTNGGKFTLNQMETKLKVGDKVKAGEIVAKNPKHITDNDIFGDPVGATGAILRVAFRSDASTHEDSTYMTQHAAEALGTLVVKKFDSVIGRYANVKYLAPVGTMVKANDPLLIFDDSDDEFSSKILQSMNELEDSDGGDHISHTNIYSKVTGKVVDVKVYYTVDESELTESLRKNIDKLYKPNKEREKTIKKYMSPKDSNTILNPSMKSATDSTGRVKGVKIDDGVMIEFYIEYLDTIATGDKITFTSAIKGICNLVIDDEVAGYGLSNPNKKVDCFVSTIGVFKRMAHDIEKLGAGNRIMIDYKDQMLSKYGQRLGIK